MPLLGLITPRCFGKAFRVAGTPGIPRSSSLPGGNVLRPARCTHPSPPPPVLSVALSLCRAAPPLRRASCGLRPHGCPDPSAPSTRVPSLCPGLDTRGSELGVVGGLAVIASVSWESSSSPRAAVSGISSGCYLSQVGYLVPGPPSWPQVGPLLQCGCCPITVDFELL